MTCEYCKDADGEIVQLEADVYAARDENRRLGEENDRLRSRLATATREVVARSALIADQQGLHHLAESRKWEPHSQREAEHRYAIMSAADIAAKIRAILPEDVTAKALAPLRGAVVEAAMAAWRAAEARGNARIRDPNRPMLQIEQMTAIKAMHNACAALSAASATAEEPK